MNGKDAFESAGARFYDATYAVIRRGDPDVAFYRALAQERAGPVLELGCGTGRVLLPIAEDGLACTGLDASDAMLDRFRAKGPPSNVRLVRGSMEAFAFPGERFGLIFSAFRAFQHLLTVEDQLSCLDSVRRHLLPGGRFAFDVFAPRLERVAVVDEPEVEDARFEENGVTILRFSSAHRDLASQVMEVTFRYEMRPAGGSPSSELFRTRMRWFFRYELEHLLARAAFSSIEFFGGFDRRPYDYFSGETVVMARSA